MVGDGDDFELGGELAQDFEDLCTGRFLKFEIEHEFEFKIEFACEIEFEFKIAFEIEFELELKFEFEFEFELERLDFGSGNQEGIKTESVRNHSRSDSRSDPQRTPNEE